MSPRRMLIRSVWIGALAVVFAAGAFLAYVGWYTTSDRILPGVTVGRVPVGGLTAAEARRRVAGDAIRRPPALAGGPGAAGGWPVGGSGGVGPQLPPPQPLASAPSEVRLWWQEHEWRLSLHEIGAGPDIDGAVEQAFAIGRDGRVWQRATAYLNGMHRGYTVPVEMALGEEKLTARLERIAATINRPPVDARYDLAADKVAPEVNGQALDVEASRRAVTEAVLAGRSEVELVVRPVPARVTRRDLAGLRRRRIARFTTKILSADAGRVHNIGLAVSKINGVILQPGESFSFNDVVGPRDKEHGWAQAHELYQGEFVLGYGGGICQVSSTLYNSVLLAGLQVQERYHHSRPLQYIQPGRDATVAWDVLDFRFRNSADVPILIGARVLPGSPQEIEVTVYAPRPVHQGEISLEEAEVKYFPPPMEEIMDPTLPENERVVLDEGHYGIEVKTYRVFRHGGRERRELVSHDRYEPKPGKVKVGVGNRPGSERLLDPGIQ